MLGERLRQLREERKFTQKDVAATLGVDRTTYTIYEKGTSNPTLNSLRILSKLYNVSVDYLIGVSDVREINNDTNSEIKVAACVDPIAYLGKEEKTVLMCCRILDNNSRSELIEYVRNFTKERCKGLFDSEDVD
ncbi:MAG: helix-turn-helix domain-containing protein [Faecalibacterium sp.]|nr:helix-turn-helix domain-containing protein [Ruminococcus sp.]MCM1391537.1 helix-turn-helix domain-containing protein [Ruminococcus sp.]MCM1485975.1 helix-turn-helix domain-containing protein [Faecalibacterium sp.]